MKRQAKPKFEWYHAASRDYFEVTFVQAGDDPPSGFSYGPFRTYRDCINDMIAYYQCDLNDARTGLKNARALRKRDIKPCK